MLFFLVRRLLWQKALPTLTRRACTVFFVCPSQFQDALPQKQQHGLDNPSSSVVFLFRASHRCAHSGLCFLLISSVSSSGDAITIMNDDIDQIYHNVDNDENIGHHEHNEQHHQPFSWGFGEKIDPNKVAISPSVARSSPTGLCACVSELHAVCKES